MKEELCKHYCFEQANNRDQKKTDTIELNKNIFLLDIHMETDLILQEL